MMSENDSGSLGEGKVNVGHECGGSSRKAY